MDSDPDAPRLLTIEEALQELQAEPDRNILLTLLEVRRNVKRMRTRRNSGQVEVHVKDGYVQSVIGPDSMRIPKE
jgi:hypothetical protein